MNEKIDPWKTLPSHSAVAALSEMISSYIRRLCPDGASGSQLATVFPTFSDATLDAALKTLVTTPTITRKTTALFAATKLDDLSRQFDFQISDRPQPWQSRRYKQITPLITPRWIRATHKLFFGEHDWSFDTKAKNVVAILDAFEKNSWHPLETVGRWMPMKDQIHGREPHPYDAKCLFQDQIRDALTVIKNKTKPILMWHQRGVGAWWEPLP